MNPFRKHRLEKNITVLNLSKTLGVTHNVIYRWEHDETYPSVPNFIALADALGVTRNALMNELIKYRKETYGDL